MTLNLTHHNDPSFDALGPCLNVARPHAPNVHGHVCPLNVEPATFQPSGHARMALLTSQNVALQKKNVLTAAHAKQCLSLDTNGIRTAGHVIHFLDAVCDQQWTFPERPFIDVVVEHLVLQIVRPLSGRPRPSTTGPCHGNDDTKGLERPTENPSNPERRIPRTAIIMTRTANNERRMTNDKNLEDVKSNVQSVKL